MRYENQLTVANGDFVMLHGRFSGLGPGVPSWIVVDIVRMENGLLAEHWDVIQDEATREQSKGGNPMFGDAFPLGRGTPATMADAKGFCSIFSPLFPTVRKPAALRRTAWWSCRSCMRSASPRGTKATRQ